MNSKIMKFFKAAEKLNYWSVILIPFFMGIAPAPMNVFMGLVVATYPFVPLARNKRFDPKTGITLPILAFFIITCLSITNSVNTADSLKGGIGRLAHYILILLVIFNSLKDRLHAKRIIISICFGISLISLDSIWQVIAGSSFIRPGYAPVVNIGLVRATSSFKDSNILGIYLSGFAPLLFGITFYYIKGRKKIPFILLSLLVLAGIALTYSRPTLLAVYLVFVFFALARKNRAFLALLILSLLISPFIAPKPVKDWAKQVEYNPLRFMCNDDRIAVYLHSLNMIKAHPFIGVGANAFMNSYRYYKTYPEYNNVVTLDEMKAHNNFLHMAGETGLLGLGAFIWLIAVLFTRLSRLYRNLNDGFLKITLLGLTACIISFLINGLTESSLYYSRVGLLFWYLAGLALSYVKINDAA